jgi:chromosome segregation ATPase
MRTAEWAERTAARLDEEAALANLSKNKMTIEEQLAKIEAEAAAVLAERDDLRATVEKLTVGAASELEAVKAEAAAKDARIVELSGAIEASDKLVAELTEKVIGLEASKVSASAEAAKIAASVGVAPIEVSPADGVESVADNRSVLEKYMALSGDARTAFFNANKAAIMAAMRVS